MKNIYSKKILITGGAGFIGAHLAKKLIARKYKVVLIDRLNSANVELKKARLKNLLLKKDYVLYNLELSNSKKIKNIFKKHKFDVICHLAAKTNLEFNSELYNRTNILGTISIFELAKEFKVPKVVFASSSMVYGNSRKKLFTETDTTDHPLSVYAAAKKSDEVLAYTYHHLFGIKMVGLRFFTTYGPWGRPDMAISRFTEKILKNETIEIQNFGKIQKDFNYIDDTINGLVAAIEKNLDYELINLGSGKSTTLEKIIKEIEKNLNKKAKKKYIPLQPGDLTHTRADIQKAAKLLGYKPKISLEDGIKKFVAWKKITINSYGKS